MESITDLEKVQRKIHEWERSREVGTWYDRIQSVNERPPQPPRGELFMRLVSTINEGHFEYRHSLKQDWIPVREKQDLEHLENLHERAAVRMDAQTEILLVSLSDYARAEDALTLDLDQEAACALMNKLFHQPALKGYLVNLDENYFKVVDEPLKWICQDDPIEPDCYALQLATSTGINVSHSVRQLPGQQELYQSDETVFPGPPRWLESTEVEPRYSIPKQVIDSLEGVEFLRKIGASLPPSMEDRVVDIDLRGTFDMKIVRGLTSAETEHVLCEVSARDASGYRTEKLGKDGWDVSHQEPMKNKVLLRFIREHLYPIPGLLEEMGFSYDPQVGAFKARVTRQFPENSRNGPNSFRKN